MMGPRAAMLGRRLHLQHGPIDLIIEAWGPDEEVSASYRQAQAAFNGLLDELASELPLLRMDARERRWGERCRDGKSLNVADRMIAAVQPHDCFVSPMAAVAGAVADHVLAAMRVGRTALQKVMVNNGGDIALWLNAEQTATIGIAEDHGTEVKVRPINLTHLDEISGIATSGWRGRSHSLGIADFVTVFAKDAATADAAATLIANAVDVPASEKITRRPAQELSPDSDLGARLVTVNVNALDRTDVEAALASGLHAANDMVAKGIISAALLGLQNEQRSTTKPK